MVKITAGPMNHLNKDSVADALQVRSVSVERLDKRIGIIDDDLLDEIVQAVHLVISDL